MYESQASRVLTEYSFAAFLGGLVVGAICVALFRWFSRSKKSSGVAKYRMLLAVVVSIGIYSLAPGVALAQYPDGARDPGNWYFCYASQFNDNEGTFTSVPWSEDMLCETLLFKEVAGGGGFIESIDMAASVLAEGSDASHGRAAKLRGFVIPPRGMKDFNYACTAGATQCHNGGTGSVSSSVRSAVGSLFSEVTTGWVLNSTAATSGSCATITTDVVGLMRSSVYDTWWTNDTPVNWNTSGSTVGTYWEISALTISDKRSSGASFRCHVTGWVSNPTWLASNPEWGPGPEDLVPVATATPSTTWSVNPWVPITDSVNAPEFELGPPGTEVCTIVIPAYGWTWDSVEYGWDLVEFCSTEYDLTLRIFGIDLGTYLVTFFLLGGVGVLVSIIKRA